jgi:ATP-binding protein involved in chromosome partitioning
MNRSEVIKALGTVLDPASGQDIIAAHLVERLSVEDKHVSFELTLPPASAANKFELHAACVEAIKGIDKEADVHVHFKQGKAKPSSDNSNRKLPQVKNIIAVASGKGGVGKSTVSANIALALKSLGASVGILDADIYGPSIPLMFGLQGKKPQVKNLNGKPHILPLIAHDIPMISMGFIIEPEQAVVLRGPRLGAILNQFINEVYWDKLDFLIVDLPPGTGDVQLSLAQTVPITGSVLVTTPQDVALADAVKAMNMFKMESIDVPILGVVENMSWFTPAELPENKYYIFGQDGGKKLAKEAGTMLLGQVPIVQAVREGGDQGTPVFLNNDKPTVQGAFEKIAKNLLTQIAIRAEYLEPTRVVKINE